MNLFAKLKSLLVVLFLLTPTLLYTAIRPASPALAQSNPPTYDTNIIIQPNSNETSVCFDSLNPDTLVVSESFTGTSILNWHTGARTHLAKAQTAACGPNGTIYVGTPGDPGTRFSALDPAGHPIAHTPQYVAADGSRQVYATEVPASYTQTLHLWASPDAGDTWQQRTLPPTGQLASLAVAETDARAIYALMEDRTTQPTPSWIYFSSDAGATWALRSTAQGRSSIKTGLIAVPGHNTPVESLYLQASNGLGGSGGASSYYISTDGARTFTQVDMIFNVGYHDIEVVHSQEGIVRSRHGQYFGPQELTLTTDGGTTWTPLPVPALATPPTPAPAAPSHPGEAVLTVAAVAPANLFLSSLEQGLWQSPDNGHSWTQLTATGAQVVATSPYLPLAVLWTDADHRLHVTELPDAGTHQTAAVLPNHAIGSAYYPVPGIGHNTPEVFLQYWTAHGGLAQFGYPRTEAFPEVNAADGKIYLAQYFERNRFEYHPEYAGSDAEILLGLLGNEQTAARRAAGEAPFNRVTDPATPGVTYVPQIGHTLQGRFLDYWTTHGGLALYGYPISEQFQETNPDGKTYTVQYFERNRFEYHPENAGSPYETLLGLLGNTLLEQKGWK